MQLAHVRGSVLGDWSGAQPLYLSALDILFCQLGPAHRLVRTTAEAYVNMMLHHARWAKWGGLLGGPWWF